MTDDQTPSTSKATTKTCLTKGKKSCQPKFQRDSSDESIDDPSEMCIDESSSDDDWKSYRKKKLEEINEAAKEEAFLTIKSGLRPINKSDLQVDSFVVVNYENEYYPGTTVNVDENGAFVNGGSLAEKAGLQVADAVIKVNGQDVYNLRHKDAQDAIVKAGNSFEVVVSRGPGGTWKPSVMPVGNVPAPSPVGGAPAPVTKTSLAYKGPASPAIGTGHNVAARPFSAAPQGSVKSITSKQYNNPVGLYSEQTIAETLSAQAEVLAGGVLGVNFMKNEKTYNATNSEVLKMVQEIDKEPKEPEPVEPVVQPGGVSAPPPTALGLRHVAPPENKPPSTTSPQQPLQPGQNVCADCERLIVGVFVRIKDKNLHVECFKCATCGTSLKNVGYYNINNKLYCDIHAKLVARSNPPAPNLDPITIPPGGRIPPGAISAPQPSGGVQSPQPGTLAPLPFHAPRLKPSHVNAPRTFKVPVLCVVVCCFTLLVPELAQCSNVTFKGFGN
ncbi:LIM domain-binding protein 3 [Homalodisca vitripennis]|nr:LIM domain-binding protein 3 [Homalodisca vitripennis]